MRFTPRASRKSSFAGSVDPGLASIVNSSTRVRSTCDVRIEKKRVSSGMFNALGVPPPKKTVFGAKLFSGLPTSNATRRARSSFSSASR